MIEFGSKTSKRIGVLIREDHLKSRMQIFEGVMDYCLDGSSIQSFLIPIRDGKPPSPEVLAEMDGLVCWASVQDRWLKDIWNSGMPVVNCSNAMIGEVPTVSAGNIVDLAFDFLMEMGRKTIGYVSFEGHDAGCSSNMNKFITRLTEHGVETHVFTKVKTDPGLHPEHVLLGDDEDELATFLKELPKPALVWCSHDEMAALVWRVVDRLQISVPEEIAILGLGDHPCAIHSSPGITSIHIPGVHLGREAAKLVHQHIGGLTRLTSDFHYVPQNPAAIIERASTGGTNPMNRGIQRAWRMLQEYPDGGLTVEHLIEASRVSRISFYKQFEKTFGLLPGKALRNSRVKKAKEYLASTDMLISQVGRRCGFSGESEFSNFFKRETGKTPKEWRTNALKQSASQFGAEEIGSIDQMLAQPRAV